jgi:hypothetical protein
MVRDELGSLLTGVVVWVCRGGYEGYRLKVVTGFVCKVVAEASECVVVMRRDVHQRWRLSALISGVSGLGKSDRLSHIWII